MPRSFAPVTGDPPAVPAEPGESQSIRLQTNDGAGIAADLVTATRPWAGAVVCHPHPAYGGDRHNPVVDRIFHSLAATGATVLRFDFRPGGDGSGTEQHDVLAGVDRVASRLPPGLPLWLIGYSFGADIALSVGDPRVTGWAAVAPPLHFGPPPRAAAADERPVLVVAAERDRFSPPGRLREATASWPHATLTVVPGADHFLVGAADQVADVVVAWLRSQADPSGGATPPARP